jgi:hypothetical protein
VPASLSDLPSRAAHGGRVLLVLVALLSGLFLDSVAPLIAFGGAAALVTRRCISDAWLATLVGFSAYWLYVLVAWGVTQRVDRVTAPRSAFVRLPLPCVVSFLLVEVVAQLRRARIEVDGGVGTPVAWRAALDLWLLVAVLPATAVGVLQVVVWTWRRLVST